MTSLDKKLIQYFPGKVVRKDLTKSLKSNAIVPSYVLEYLLGQYCSTDDEEIIAVGIQKVKDIISKNYVHRDEANLVKSLVKENGSHRLIDKISVDLNDKDDQYEADFANLGLRNIPVSDEIVRKNPKLLVSGVWSIVNLAYFHTDDKKASPWIIDSLKPIQISVVDLEDYKAQRSNFSTSEWIDILLQTMGLNPNEFNQRSKLLQLVRLVPFVENNYNMIELGPKGTGKSHIYSELSPNGILVSGGEVTKAKLFINNSNGQIGLVGYWDVVAYDEFAGKTKRTDQALVDIMKNYMANGSFSRGTGKVGASASMVFVGNTDRSVPYMLKNSNLFEALPKGYHDSAFLDRIWAYNPGWEVEKLRNEMFSEGYGFVVDYLAEILKQLRKEDRSAEYENYFELSDTITTRDKTGIVKTYAGLLKIIFPNSGGTLEELKELFEFSIESRKRVKDQLIKIDETFEDVDFTYKIKGEDIFRKVTTLEEMQYLTGSNYFKEDNESSQEASKEIGTKEPVLTPKYVEVKDNQKGISYNNLFGAYFKGSEKIKIVDPFIRLPYQFRNLMELMSVITSKKQPEEIVEVELITSTEFNYLEQAKERFDDIKSNLSAIGVNFSYEFSDSIHDRIIQIDNNWKIILGRGLDIWNKTNGYFDIAETNQLYRTCKSFNMNIVSQIGK